MQKLQLLNNFFQNILPSQYNPSKKECLKFLHFQTILELYFKYPIIIIQLSRQPMKKGYHLSHIISLKINDVEPAPAKGNLYLSGVGLLNHSEDIMAQHIGCVLTIIDEWAFNHFKVLKKIQFLNIKKHKWINIEDDQEVEIYPHFQPCIQFIRQHLQTTNVLVHCQMGISRSASIVIAFIMKQLGLSLEDAKIYVKQRRNIIQPNQNFEKNLRQFENNLNNNK